MAKQTEVDSLKTSVSNGKSAIASAITDKGVSTAASADFSTMASNIRNIATGPDVITKTFTDYNSLTTSNAQDGKSAWNSGGWFIINTSAKSNFLVYGYAFTFNAYITIFYGNQILRYEGTTIRERGTLTRSGNKLIFPQYFLSSKNSSGSISSIVTFTLYDYD